jgi:hypothetical protein
MALSFLVVALFASALVPGRASAAQAEADAQRAAAHGLADEPA